MWHYVAHDRYINEMICMAPLAMLASMLMPQCLVMTLEVAGSESRRLLV